MPRLSPTAAMSMPARSAPTADGESGMEAITTFSPAFLRAARSGTVSFLRSSGTECCLLRSLIERLYLPADGVGVRSERGFVQVRLGPRLGVEVAVLVHPAHQHGG